MAKWCLDCRWRARRSEGYTDEERSRAAIVHHTETGHTIVTMPALEPRES